MKKILYLGLNPPQKSPRGIYTHCPIIQIIPRNPDEPAITQAYRDLKSCTHIIFTSKTTVRIFVSYLSLFGYSLSDIQECVIISVGQVTSKTLEDYGLTAVTAQNETAEGIVEELKKMNLDDAYVFWPHSALSRPILTDFFQKEKIRYRNAAFYDTVTLHPNPKPNLRHFDEILFTSPSTVDAFLEVFGELPKDHILTPIGPITESKLNRHKLRCDISH